MSVGLKRLILKLCLQIVLGYFGVIIIIFVTVLSHNQRVLKVIIFCQNQCHM